MRRTFAWALSLAFLAAPGAAHAQAPADGGTVAADAADVPQGAFEFLREHRAELRITEQQAERLREIADGVQRTNAPLRAQLRRERAAFLAQRRAELMRMSPAERQAELARLQAEGGRVPPAWGPLLRQMRENQRGAMQQAQAVLTREQKQRARELIREWRGKQAGAGAGRPAREAMRRRWARRAAQP
ncbi:MAG TPA: hypothetical protein VFH27_11510 [Longimicrobiaceae bacterium]|nr:hypothetical protein [Longimicrobiaceae bacterium]